MIKCIICDERFKEIRSYVRHLKLKHLHDGTNEGDVRKEIIKMAKPEFKKNQICNKCSKGYSTIYSLQRHKCSHIEKSNFLTSFKKQVSTIITTLNTAESIEILSEMTNYLSDLKTNIDENSITNVDDGNSNNISLDMNEIENKSKVSSKNLERNIEFESNVSSVEETNENGYSNGKIYLLFESSTNKIFYAGSTIRKLDYRKGEHLHSAKNGDQRRVYKYIRMLGCNDDSFYIKLYQNYSCANSTELRQRESEIIRLLLRRGEKLTNMVISGKKQRSDYFLLAEVSNYYDKIFAIYHKYVPDINYDKIKMDQQNLDSLKNNTKSKIHVNLIRKNNINNDIININDDIININDDIINDDKPNNNKPNNDNKSDNKPDNKPDNKSDNKFDNKQNNDKPYNDNKPNNKPNNDNKPNIKKEVRLFDQFSKEFLDQFAKENPHLFNLDKFSASDLNDFFASLHGPGKIVFLPK
jgi:hypothetical protein